MRCWLEFEALQHSVRPKSNTIPRAVKAKYCEDVDLCTPVLVEDIIRNNSSMLLEQLWLILRELVDGPLFLTPLAPLLPNSVLVIQVLKKPD